MVSSSSLSQSVGGLGIAVGGASVVEVVEVGDVVVVGVLQGW